MTGTQELAAVIIAFAIIPFVSAWEVPGPGGEKYRETVKNFLRIPGALILATAGAIVTTGAWAAALLDPRDHENSRLKMYAQRRGYKGEHRAMAF